MSLAVFHQLWKCHAGTPRPSPEAKSWFFRGGDSANLFKVLLMTTGIKSRSQGKDVNELRSLLPIALGTLVPADELDFNLYIPSENDRPTLFRGRHYPLHQEDITRLMAGNIKTLYIKISEHEVYCEYLRETVLNAPELPAARRVSVLTAVNRSAFEAAFASRDSGRYLEFAESFGEDLADTICGHAVALHDMLCLIEHDYYTFTHVVNVTIYCIAIAINLGHTDRDTLCHISVGGLLHDYGKRFVSPRILNYPDRLSEEKSREIQRHPLAGFCEFTDRQSLNWGQLMMIYQHHERPDGKGYPVGIHAEDIHPWARICKVADVFDALTSDRPYRRADTKKDVLEFMGKKTGREFDEEVFQCFQAMNNSKN